MAAHLMRARVGALQAIGYGLDSDEYRLGLCRARSAGWIRVAAACTIVPAGQPLRMARERLRELGQLATASPIVSGVHINDVEVSW